MKHKYEVGRKYPWEATTDSVCPVPGETYVIALYGYISTTHIRPANSLTWNTHGVYKINGFIVIEYPPEEKTCWVNIYGNDHYLCPHETKEGADKAAGTDRKACKELTWTEGEGL